jgi:hypothetical protein
MGECILIRLETYSDHLFAHRHRVHEYEPPQWD